jgi:hypothetical protein
MDEAKDIVSRWSKEALPEKIAELLDKAYDEGVEASGLFARLERIRRDLLRDILPQKETK